MMSELDHEIEQLKEKYETLLSSKTIKTFSAYPLSHRTLKGLSDANYITATEIQRESIPHGLLGKDVVGMAETGSGKTLAFLIPVIEHLFINKWTRAVGGLAALIISPTRELAYQLFETLRKIGKYHDFSAGLIIGGKNLCFEKSRMDQCNILICTPGRLLQHMDENPLFDACTVEILVLDEADRCLDMGFEKSLDAIIKNLPLNRQNFLFSATQNTVDYIKRLKLKNPVHVGKHWQNNDKNINAIPELLQQNYIVIELEKKITMLWSFIKNHLKQKIVVFLSSCKQVKYLYEVFCKLRPGISLLALYGTLSQDRRISIYNEFFKKNHGVLLATDIASRGLDFPDVNWVVQLDCPEDVTQYIHRAGRSARNKSLGECLLVLMPSEENAMIKELKSQNIDLRKIEIDPKKLFSPDAKIKALCAWSPELKSSAQRAFIAYIKSVYLMKNKNIFDVNCFDFQKFAESLGLITTPRIRFLDRHLKKNQCSVNKLENKDVYEDNFLKIKRVDHAILDNSTYEIDVPQVKRSKKITKASLAKKSIRKNTEINHKRLYDEEGNEVICGLKEVQKSIPSMDEHNINGFDINSAKNLLIQEDKHDKMRFKEMVKSRHRKLKEKRKKSKNQNYCSEEDNNNDEIDVSWSPDLDKVHKSEKRDCLSSSNEIFGKKFKATQNVSLKDTEYIASQLLSYT